MDKAAPQSLGNNTNNKEKKPFCIEYNDEICVYECEKADEIVSRINFILSINHQ